MNLAVMKMIKPGDILRITQENKDNLMSKLVLHILRLNKLDKLCEEVYDDDPEVFLDSLLQALGVSIDFKEEELERIPAQGPFITVSNHPFGGLDAIILLKLLLKRRPDYKVLTYSLLKQILPIQDYFIEINEGEKKESSLKNKSLQEALQYIEAGRGLGVFPAGDVSVYQPDTSNVEDREWRSEAVKMIKMAHVPVIPIYFRGSNSLFFYLLGFIHPVLRNVRLPSELLNKKNRIVKLRIGNEISVGAQDSFHDPVQYGKFLRAKTYLLGSSLEPAVKSFFHRSLRAESRIEPIAEPVDTVALKNEVSMIAEECMLFSIKEYDVYCAPSVKIPNVLNEIGRLRELTFRAVGEGTNRSIDLDEYDLYYSHLFIWDKDAGKIVGAYRIGKGKEIIERYGKKGFYINSLFKMRKEMLPILYSSIELGRSFIQEEYQRKPLPLFMLWKGILYFLLKNPDYRYLLGPVTISGRYTEVSKELIMRFVMENYYDNELARYVLPRSKYLVESNDPKVRVMLEATGKDISILDKMIGDIEPSSDKLPVLLKKYISLNAKIIGFNIDPKFNMCLDGLLILDIFDVPMTVIESLSKEFNDNTILNRFSADSVEV